jgi:signal transduction histidine kinase
VSRAGAVLLPMAVAYGLAADLVAQHHGRTSTYAGATGWALAVELAAGSALVAAGFALSQSGRGRGVGPLVLAAGFVWFAPDWIGWEGGPALVRSLGMVAAGLAIPLLVHAALAFPQGRLASRAERALVAAVYVEAAVIAVGRALFRDPFAVVGCWDNCTVNSFLIRSEPRLARALDWVDLRFAIALAAVFAALVAWRLTTATSSALGRLAPVLAAAAALLAFGAGRAVDLLREPIEDPRAASFAALFVGRSAAAAALAVALGWALVRTRRTRRAVERLAVELAELPRPGALEAALGVAAGDPSLRISYRLRGDDRYVDHDGRAVDRPSPSGTRTVTPILRDGRPVALVEHDPTVLDGGFQGQIGSAARLAVENERLQSEALAQLLELRASRARIVAAGDEVRRRLERDLHDGAQQRLVALSFALRIARAKLGPEPDPRVAEPLERAERSLADALAAVRAVANGLFPATLASSGLATAVEELAELAPITIDLVAVPDRRLPTEVEAAAYGVIREAVENAALHSRANAVAISASYSADAVHVEARDDGIGGADPARGLGLLDVADRVGALGGRLTILSPVGAGTRVEAEIPCA